MAKRIIVKRNTKIKITNLEQYGKKYQDYQKGKMTTEEWYEFCMACLDELLIENSKSLEKLNNNY